jgi:hypothetical protein
MKIRAAPTSILVAVAGVFVAACSTPTGGAYLEDYDRMGKGKYLDQFWSDTARIRQGKYTRVVLASIEPVGIEDQKGVTIDQAVEWLRESFSYARLDADPPILIDLGEPGRVARLELAVTRMDPGSATARILAGELGAGHADVQVEGRLKDAEDGALLATFAQRTRASGAIGFQDVGGDAGPEMVQEIMGMIGRAIEQEVGEALGRDVAASSGSRSRVSRGALRIGA